MYFLFHVGCHTRNARNIFADLGCGKHLYNLSSKPGRQAGHVASFAEQAMTKEGAWLSCAARVVGCRVRTHHVRCRLTVNHR